MAEWPAHSRVVLEFVDYAEDETCEVRLRQSDIPQSVDRVQLKAGWMEQVLRPLSILCGYPIIAHD